MVCIYCGSETKVTNSRPKKADNQTWRRLKCLKCGSIVTSIEQLSLNDLIMVKKRSGNLEPFLRDKIFLSIYRSVDHLTDPITKTNHLTNTVLRHIQKDNELTSATITSVKLSSIICNVLKHYNAAASVRYLAFQTKLQLPTEVRHLFL